MSGNYDELDDSRSEFIQALDRWTVYSYQHTNALTINSRTYAVSDGDFGIVPPGARAAHGRCGAGTPYSYFAFDMPGLGTPRVSIPHIVHSRPDLHREWQVSNGRLVESTVYLRAFAWDFMCQISRSLAANRSEAVLYDAEAWILANLGRRFTILEMCEELSVSSRQVLRAFRREHGVTVQEFVIQKRVQEAARLLTSTNLEPKEIAVQVGVPDLQHFNKLMRQHTGVSPRAFRSSGR
jgi:AraC-like DNA-binding protein